MVIEIYSSLIIDKIIGYLGERVRSWYAEFRDPHKRKESFIYHD